MPREGVKVTIHPDRCSSMPVRVEQDGEREREAIPFGPRASEEVGEKDKS